MAKGQMRSNKEKKKPKQDKNKKKGAEAGMHGQVKLGHLVHEPIGQEAIAGDQRAPTISATIAPKPPPSPFNPRVDRCQNVLCFSPHSLHMYGMRTRRTFGISCPEVSTSTATTSGAFTRAMAIRVAVACGSCADKEFEADKRR